MPDVSESEVHTTTLGDLQGSTYGGQQPIWQSHVYLMKASTNGYKTTSTSMLVNSANTFPDTTVMGTPGNPAYYLVTNGFGNFDISGDYSCSYNATTPSQSDQLYLVSMGGNATFTGGGDTPAGGASNAYIGLMAALGQCPSDGTFVGHLSFIYMNEVSTVAAAYALAGFAGNSYSVGSPSTAQARVGMANAFANANQLYDVTGSAPGHEARQVTPGSTTSVAGTVPYRLINTLANIMANCVNQGATAAVPTSGPCLTLYSLTGNAPDTASAILYIAQHPYLGSSANVQTMFNLQGTNVEFADDLSSKPNDFSVAIDYQGTTTTNPVDVAIDQTGNAWVTNSSGSVLKLTPAGLHAAGSPFSLQNANYISIDPSGNAWVTANSLVYEMTNSGSAVTGSPFSNGGLATGLATIATDGSGAYVANPNAGLNILTLNTSGNVMRITTPGGIPTFATYYNGITGLLGGAVLNNIPAVTQVASGSTGTLWVSGNPLSCLLSLSIVCGGLAVQQLNTSTAFPAGLVLSTPTWTTSNWISTSSPVSYDCFLGLLSCKAVEKPGFLAVDSAGSGWVSIDAGTSNFGSGNTPADKLARINASGTVTNLLTGGGLNLPQGVAVDGAGAVFVANQGGGSLTEYASSAFVTGSTGITGAGNGTTPTSVLNTPTTLDIDPSGDIWVVNPSGNAGFITEFIGLATPVVRPLSSGKVGVAP